MCVFSSQVTPCPSQAFHSSPLPPSQSNYNDSHAIMDLVLFEDAVQHVSRIARIISFPRGNALLVGVGGSRHSFVASCH